MWRRGARFTTLCWTTAFRSLNGCAVKLTPTLRSPGSGTHTPTPTAHSAGRYRHEELQEDRRRQAHRGDPRQGHQGEDERNQQARVLCADAQGEREGEAARRGAPEGVRCGISRHGVVPGEGDPLRVGPLRLLVLLERLHIE